MSIFFEIRKHIDHELHVVMTPDENFIIDFHPDNSNIIIGAGFSGHGFKFTPLIGKMISQMVIDGETKYDRSQFAIKSKIIQI